MWLRHMTLLYRARREAAARREKNERQTKLMKRFRALGALHRLPADVQVLFEQFEQRRLNPPERVDNSKLHAGSNMHYYCQACGQKSQELAETHSETPKLFCADCEQAIEKTGAIR